ncbi:hypothetical protein [Flavobacterium phragmitis]|uniref:Uncharacterized protein n=1 Tax=Flavobacterium phragmitis TaxID=739143 RepID=A0A1I1U840_9FLAO|nr:hypothetical protein [Flavobacterium phragmitis]SFD66939.1 hypothetical protein SAMN05216297_110243 [Flavobacterium phragmitis]
MENNSTKDRLSNFLFMISQMLPPIGFFLYLKYKSQFPNKAKKALRGALIGIPVGIVMGYLLNNFIIN